MSTIKRLLEKTYYYWLGKKLFGAFGKGSYCIKPLRVVGGKHVHIGKNVSILNALRIEAHSRNNRYNCIIDIGDNTNIEQNVHITGAEQINIGKEVSILGGTVITDIIHPYNDTSLPASKQDIMTKPVNIGDQCFLGMYSMIMPGVTLGRHVIVGAHSVVTMNVPDCCVVAGNPAKIIKRYDREQASWIRMEGNYHE